MVAYQLMLYALIAGFVLVFWKAAQWAMMSTRAARDAQSLTPSDLLGLSESCEQLIMDLRTAADECTAQVEAAVRKAELLLGKLDGAMPATIIAEVVRDAPEAPAGANKPARAFEEQLASARDEAPEDPVQRMYWLADRGLPVADIARMENRSSAEVKLILDLRRLEAADRQAA